MPSAATVRNFSPPQPNPLERKPPSSELTPHSSSGGVRPSLEAASNSPLDAALTNHERLLTAREVAARLGVSERWVRDHTTRRSPKIRAIKLGTLIRYNRIDVENFVQNLSTERAFSQSRLGV